MAAWVLEDKSGERATQSCSAVLSPRLVTASPVAAASLSRCHLLQSRCHLLQSLLPIEVSHCGLRTLILYGRRRLRGFTFLLVIFQLGFSG